MLKQTMHINGILPQENSKNWALPNKKKEKVVKQKIMVKHEDLPIDVETLNPYCQSITITKLEIYVRVWNYYLAISYIMF